MDKEAAIKVALFLTELLEEDGITVGQTILFGSCATNEAQVDSDVDVAIVSDDFVNKDLFERASLTIAAEVKTIRHFHVPIDLISLTPNELTHSPSLVAQFVRSGEPVFIA